MERAYNNNNNNNNDKIIYKYEYTEQQKQQCAVCKQEYDDCKEPPLISPKSIKNPKKAESDSGARW